MDSEKSRQLSSNGDTDDEDILIFFGFQFLFFLLIPFIVLINRLFFQGRFGLKALFRPPLGRLENRRSLASALRFYIFELTELGYYLDIIQAVLSTASCLMFIVVASSGKEDDSVALIEFAFSWYFFADFLLRLYTSRDSLMFFFGLTSLLDFVTVVPAIVTIVMTDLFKIEAEVRVIEQVIRILRVFRIFRVIRVLRSVSVSQNFAFQRQVIVLILTVLSLVFAAAGLLQVLESTDQSDYPFHKAVYYAAITVIGRPGIPFTTVLSAVFMTVMAMSSATIIPTFVAELIRLWHDNSATEKYVVNPEAPHVILAGDTNASRLRVLVEQYLHPSRDPNAQSPLVILAEPKPEGALRLLLEEHKHSGVLRYIRGSPRRAADLSRAGALGAKSIVLLTDRSTLSPESHDTDSLSSVISAKTINPRIQVFAQLLQTSRAHQLNLVPGFSTADRAFSGVSLGATMMGLGLLVPGLSTLMLNLLHRPERASVELSGKSTESPSYEYLQSQRARVRVTPVTRGLEGLTFAAAARAAALRHNITLIGATVPDSDGFAAVPASLISEVFPGVRLPFAVRLFPAAAVLRRGMVLFALVSKESDLKRFCVDTGGHLKSAYENIRDHISFATWDWQDPRKRAAFHAQGGAASSVVLADLSESEGQPRSFPHNDGAAKDLSVPWCFREDHLPATRAGPKQPCEDCARTRTVQMDAGRLCGRGIVSSPGSSHSLNSKSELSYTFSTASIMDPFKPNDASQSPVAKVTLTPTIKRLPEGQIARFRSHSTDSNDGLGPPNDPRDVFGSHGRLYSQVGAGTDTVVSESKVGKSLLDVFGQNHTSPLDQVSMRLALPPEPIDAEEAGYPRGHLLILGCGPTLGITLRTLSSILRSGEDPASNQTESSRSSRKSRHGSIHFAGEGVPVAGADASSGSSVDEEDPFGGVQVVIVSQSLPVDAQLDGYYSNSSRLLKHCTFIHGSPSDRTTLLRAGVRYARSALILRRISSGSQVLDNLTDDAEAIMVSRTVHAIAPSLHLLTEIVHGVHARYLEPMGSSLCDAQRSALHQISIDKAIVEQLSCLEGALKAVAHKIAALSKDLNSNGEGSVEEEVVGESALRGLEMDQLLQLQQRMLHERERYRVSLRSLGLHSALSLSSLQADILHSILGQPTQVSGGRDQQTREELTTAAILRFVVGLQSDFSVKEDTQATAGSVSGGTGASADLYESPSFASGRVFTFSTMDTLVTESLFEPLVLPMLKQFVAGARHGRVVLLPALEARLIIRVAQRHQAVVRHSRSKQPTGTSRVRADDTDSVDLDWNSKAVLHERKRFLKQISRRLTGPSALRALNPASGTIPVEESTSESETDADLEDVQVYVNKMFQRNVAVVRESKEKGAGSTTSSVTAFTPSDSPRSGLSLKTYGEYIDGLLRLWNLLPIGLYRRVNGLAGEQAPAHQIRTISAVVGLPVSNGEIYSVNKALVSYVYTNPDQHTVISEHDFFYVIFP